MDYLDRQDQLKVKREDRREAIAQKEEEWNLSIRQVNALESISASIAASNEILARIAAALDLIYEIGVQVRS